ncbi:MAG: DUF192 domain-containing protein [Candidatus Limnocylindrales bacterium]
MGIQLIAARNATRGTVLADHLEVASSLWSKFMGLMGRRALPAGSGLWLPASNGIHMFFMRIPIDAIFVSRPGAGAPAGGAGADRVSRGPTDRGAPGPEARRVLSVHRNLRPWTGLVPLIMGADGVLELPIGTIDVSGTVVGDLIHIG